MTSPYKGLTNTALTFEISGTTTTTDEFGNVIDVDGSLAVTAFLKQPSVQQLSKIPNINVPGLTQEAVYYVGWCVVPQTLPATVHQGDWADCTLGGSSGRFYLRDLLNPPFGRSGVGSTIETAAGTRIEGWFQPEQY